MDYKYINQLLERYWQCETTLEEEEILKTFFCQNDVPVSLLQYRQLFVYEHDEPRIDRLGDDFDKRMVELVGEEEHVKARRLSMPARLMPLFRAAAMVAIVLTLGNAVQMSFDRSEPVYAGSEIEIRSSEGSDMAMGDSARIDSMQQSSVILPMDDPSPLLK